jgi:multicomponent Na+:H+ antiporter subunit G
MTLLAVALLVTGTFFLSASTLGFLRLPDFFTRMHAISKADTLGALLFVLGLACLADDLLVALKLIFVALFVFLTNPVATHALSRAARRVGIRPWSKGDPR